MSAVIWLSSYLLFKNTKIKIYTTVILLFVLYGCETWYNTSRKGQYQKVFKNRVLRDILGLRGSNRRNEKNCLIRSLMTCTPTKYWGDQVKDSEMGGVCGICGGKRAIHAGF